MMPNTMNPMQLLQSLKANPVQFVMQRKFNLPHDINANDPNAIINHLLKTNQISQQQINQAYSMMQRMGR